MLIEIIVSVLAVLGVGGILVALLNRRFEQQKQTNEHDIKIFNQSNELLTEQKLSDIANFHLLGNHSIVNNDFHRLTHYCRFFKETGNKYLDKSIAKSNQKLLEDLDRLTDFIASNFFDREFRNPTDDFKYLRPNWNLDRGDPTPEQMGWYQEYADQLKIMTQKVVKQYSEYRLTVKRKLKI